MGMKDRNSLHRRDLVSLNGKETSTLGGESRQAPGILLSVISVAKKATGPLIISIISSLPNKCNVSGVEERDIRLMLTISPNNRSSSFSLKEEIQDSVGETQEQEEVIREPGEVTREQPKETIVEKVQLPEQGTKHKVPLPGPQKLTHQYKPE
jgi:hypothetical protein